MNTNDERTEKAKSFAFNKIYFNLGLFQFLSFVRRGIFYTFMINYLFTLMGTVTYTAMLGTLNMIGSTLGQNLLWGRIADKYKIRTKLIVAGESIAALAYFIVFQIYKSQVDAQSPFTAGLCLIIGLSFLEFFWSMSDVGWAALLADVTTQKNRGRLVGMLNFIASVGRTVGITFSGILYAGGLGFSQGTIFYIVIVMLSTSATLMFVTLKTTKMRPTENEKETDIKTETQPQKHHGPVYKWFLISIAVVVIGATCVSQIFLLFLKLPTGLNATDLDESLILNAWTIGGALTCLSCGWLADRVGRVKVLLTGFILACVTPALYGLASTVTTTALVYGFNGVAFWSLQTVGFALAGDIIPEQRRGRMFSLYNAVMALSWGPAGLLIGGPISDLQTERLGIAPYNAYLNAFYISAIIVAVGTILFILKVARIGHKNS